MVEDEDHAGSRRWIYGVAAAIVAVLIGLGLTAYLWPALPAAIAGIFG
jgi:hypothetical protein